MKVKGENKRFALLRPVDEQNDSIRFAAETSNGVSDVYLYDIIAWPFIEAQDLLYAIPYNAKQINVYINSPGGDIQEGTAIYNYLVNHPAQVNVFVDGHAASIASIIAMAGETITMRTATFLMIHNGWSRISADAKGLRNEADLLDNMSGQMAGIYAAKSGKKEAEILALMDAETWFNPQEAVDFGLADSVVEPDTRNNALQVARFDLSVFENAPETLRAAMLPATGGGDDSRLKNNNNNNLEVKEMDKKLFALLVRLGMPEDNTDEQALAYLADVDVDKIIDKAERAAVVKALDAATADDDDGDGKTTFTLEDVAAASQAAIKNERSRVAEIRQAVKISGLPEDTAAEYIDGDVSADDTRKALFAKMKEHNPPIGAGAISMTADERDKFRAAVSDGIGSRCGLTVEKPAPGFENFRAASFENVARVCLEREGVDTRSLVSRAQVAKAIFRQAAAAGTFTTSDFSSIYLDVANKTLQKAYVESPATWRPLVNVVPASDFKTIYGIALSAAPGLDLVGQNGEYTSGEMTDNQESYRMYKYGKLNYITLEMFINDDLRAFVRIPQLQGAAARRKESDLVWALITGNPNMNDGNALFSAAHSNIETVSANIGVVNTDNLSSGREGMRLQTGMADEILDIRPKFVVIPVAQETDTDIVLRSTALPTVDMSAGVYNPFGGKLVPIAEPRLDAISKLAWYMFADPNQIDTIEVAYLDGNEMPYLEQSQLFERDAIGYKVRHIFGCGAMESRGMWYNPGEETS